MRMITCYTPQISDAINHDVTDWKDIAYFKNCMNFGGVYKLITICLAHGLCANQINAYLHG